MTTYGFYARTFTRQLIALLPDGPIFPRDDDSLLRELIRAFSGELAQVQTRADALRAEKPDTATELLEEWESFVGLPDACFGEVSGLAERRALVVSRLASMGGMDAASYVELADGLGYTIEIEEPTVMWAAGTGAAGARLYEGDWIFVWTVHASQFLTADEMESLECVLRRIQPAHTNISFVYDLMVVRPSPANASAVAPEVAT